MNDVRTLTFANENSTNFPPSWLSEIITSLEGHHACKKLCSSNCKISFRRLLGNRTCGYVTTKRWLVNHKVAAAALVVTVVVTVVVVVVVVVEVVVVVVVV